MICRLGAVFVRLECVTWLRKGSIENIKVLLAKIMFCRLYFYGFVTIYRLGARF